jgi:predicted nucleic acid-binding protein
LIYRYWDACTFLGWLKEEADKVSACRGGIRAAERGDIQIVTSTLTLAEVLKLKGEEPIPAADADRVRGFFGNEYITLAMLNRPIAEMAQDLVWREGVKPKDAVHVATALTLNRTVGVQQMDTFDVQLQGLSGRLGDPPLKIAEPDLPESIF